MANPNIPEPRPLGRTTLTVSGAGFGGYRISVGVEAHRMALRKALTSGINLIDTSSNYADGGSEELIGQTLAALLLDGTITRGDVVVVTKGGYIQGTNYEMVRERAEAGSGFPEVVEYADGLWHCISPEFIADQITRSLGRLRLAGADVFLLHNPEYYLNWAHKAGMPLDEARAEYYRRIANAFAYLEQEVERGRIRWYGISSNSFPHAADAYDFTSLEECVKVAERISLVHHFAVIQFPANLFERGFVAERNQSGGRTLMDVAREKNLGVLINRPLNAIAGDSLIRLADFHVAGVPFSEEHITGGIDRLMTLEREFMTERIPHFADDPEGRRALEEFISVGATMQRYWHTFESIEHFNDVLSQHFSPRLGFVAQYFREHGTQAHVDWYTSYMADARALLQAVASHYARSAQERSDRVREAVGAALGDEPSGSLSSIAIRMLLAVEGVDSVLVGMRRDPYVDDVLAALRAGPLGSEETWRKVDLAAAFGEE